MEREPQYTDQQAEEILQRASRKLSGGISEARLLTMADELGLSRDAVLSAARQVRQETLDKEERRDFALYRRRSLFSHLMSYVTVNLGLLAFNFFDTFPHRITWAWWVAGCWGIGILGQVRETFAKGSCDYEREFVKWRDKHRAGEPAGYDLSAVGIHIHSAAKPAECAEIEAPHHVAG